MESQKTLSLSVFAFTELFKSCAKCWFYVLVVFLVTPLATIAQQEDKYTLSGYVKDSANGESLVGANVIVEGEGKGATTNQYGFFSLTLPEGDYKIRFTFLGFRKKTKRVQLNDDKRLNIELSNEAIQKDEVVIEGEKKDRNVTGTEIGENELTTEKMKTLPALLGEVDVMETLKLLPGVQAAGEGISGLYVRGGGPDQNLVLLDNAVVYNTGHLFGFFSVFNPDAIKSTTLIKGGMPAKYGGRLSSVVDISMKEGNAKEFQVDGGIGLIASRLTVQGPIVKDESSFMISGRRTYIDVIGQPILNNYEGGRFKNNSYYFYDINAKANYKFSDKDRIFLSGYFGRDVFEFEAPDGSFSIEMPWGNTTGTFRWNHLFSDKLFMNLTGVYNDYNFEVRSGYRQVDFTLFSGLRDYNAKLDFDYYPHANHSVKFGAHYTHHQFTPYSARFTGGNSDINTDNIDKKNAHEAAVYAQDEFDLFTNLKVNAGIRGSLFQHIGPKTDYQTNAGGQIIDSTEYGRGEPIATYYGIEPRLRLRYKLDDQSSLKGAVTFTNQYIHMVSSSTGTLPSDMWVPSTKKTKPQRGIQYSLGYFRNFSNDMYETSIQAFYKDLDNQIAFGPNYTPELNQEMEESFVFGKGWVYGAELYAKKARGKFTGWIGYTLSWNRRQFDDLNGGEPFPAKYDRRHDLSVVASYEHNDDWKFSTTFVYGTGEAITVPVGRYLVEGKIVNQYGERNGFRMAPYHRLDLSAIYSFKIFKGNYDSELAISVYNVYNRQNPFFIYYDVDGSVYKGNVDISAKQVSLFPVLPSVTWNFHF